MYLKYKNKYLREKQYKYRIGIIDFLQKYTLKKKLEHAFKSVKNLTMKDASKAVTIQKPNFYGDRFLNMILCMVMDSCENRCHQGKELPNCCNPDNLFGYTANDCNLPVGVKINYT